MNSSRAAPQQSLSPHFVHTIRALFDVIDRDRSGYISYQDLANRWADSPADSGIPSNFLPCLRRVTPQNGMLTFERLCAGLRLALAESRQEPAPKSGFGSDPNLADRSRENVDPRRVAGRSPPQPEPFKPIVVQQQNNFGSQPAYLHENRDNYVNYDMIQRHPKIPSKWPVQNGGAQRRPAVPPPYTQALAASRSKLNEHSPPGSKARQPVAPLPNPGHNVAGLADGAQPRRIPVLESSISPVSSTTNSGSSHASGSNALYANVASVKMRDRSKMAPAAPADLRRHTVHEAIDSHVSKAEKLVIEERELCEKGLDVTNRLKNWYNERLSSLETRQKYINKGMVPVESAVLEEKLNFLRAHISEVNRRMISLIDSSEKGFPSHINLEVNRSLPQPSHDQIAWLKRQNTQLTDEISEKSNRIQELEQEKYGLQKRLAAQFHSNMNGRLRNGSSALNQTANQRLSSREILTNGKLTNGLSHHAPLSIQKPFEDHNAKPKNGLVHATLM